MACTCKSYQKSIQDVYNTSSQTLVANSNVVFTGVSVDSGTSIDQTSTTNFTIYNQGIYGVRFVGNLYNSGASAVTVEYQLTNNGTGINGTMQSVTIPAGGYSQIVINKDISVNATSGNTHVTLSIESITASTLVNANITIERKA